MEFEEWFKEKHIRENCMEEGEVCNNYCEDCEYLREYFNSMIKPYEDK